VTPPGLFLVVEGIEGAGKSTQAGLLAEWLREGEMPLTVAREPGGTRVGEAIRSLLLATGSEMPPETELLLLLAARAAFIREVVRPALERGEVMISDRFELSTLAYQGYGRGLDLDRIRELNHFATDGLAPHLTIVLELPLEEGRRRQYLAGKGRDRFEGEADGFLERVEAGYRELAAGNDPTLERLDGSGSAELIQERLRGILRRRFPERFGSPRG